MDDEFIRRHEHDEFVRRLDEEHKRQNRRIELLENTVSQINELTVSVQKLATNMEHMLDSQNEQSKRLEDLEDRDGEKWRSVSMCVITTLIGAVIGFVLKQFM